MHIYGRIYVTITRQFHLLDNNRLQSRAAQDVSSGYCNEVQFIVKSVDAFEYMHDVLNANANKVHEMRKSKVQHASIYHQSAMF